MAQPIKIKIHDYLPLQNTKIPMDFFPKVRVCDTACDDATVEKSILEFH
jgi:hypothetical protein